MLMGLLHFVLKLVVQTESLSAIQELALDFQKYVVPSFVFMAMFYSSYDVESTLVALNRYVEEDVGYAQKSIASMIMLDETVLCKQILESDIDFVTAAAEPAIEDVCKRIIGSYPEAARQHAGEEESSFFEFHLFRTLWPAVLLLDHRLRDSQTIGFRRLFMLFGVGCLVIQVISLYSYAKWWYKDLVQDFWISGHTEDIMGVVVLTAHAAAIAWICLAAWRCLGRPLSQLYAATWS